MENLKEEEEKPEIVIRLEDMIKGENGNLNVDWEMFVSLERLSHNLYNTAIERLVASGILTASPNGAYTLIGEHLNLSLLMMDERDLSKKAKFYFTGEEDAERYMKIAFQNHPKEIYIAQIKNTQNAKRAN